MTDKEKEMSEQLKELVPINLLTNDELSIARGLDKLESVKYIQSILNEGSKTAKTYYDLYVNVLPEKYVKGLGASLVSYENGWYTIEITYNGEVVKTIRK